MRERIGAWRSAGPEALEHGSEHRERRRERMLRLRRDMEHRRGRATKAAAHKRKAERRRRRVALPVLARILGVARGRGKDEAGDEHHVCSEEQRQLEKGAALGERQTHS